MAAHPYATEIKVWADDPDSWEWQIRESDHGEWHRLPSQHPLHAHSRYKDHLLHHGWANMPDAWKWELLWSKAWATPAPTEKVYEYRLVHRGWANEPSEWEWRYFIEGDKEWSDWQRHCEPVWDHSGGDYEFRRINKTIRVQIGEKVYHLPEPMREEPRDRDRYWSLETYRGELKPSRLVWEGDAPDKRSYRRGIWRTEEDAQEWANALILNGDGDD